MKVHVKVACKAFGRGRVGENLVHRSLCVHRLQYETCTGFQTASEKHGNEDRVVTIASLPVLGVRLGWS